MFNIPVDLKLMYHNANYVSKSGNANYMYIVAYVRHWEMRGPVFGCFSVYRCHHFINHGITCMSQAVGFRQRPLDFNDIAMVISYWGGVGSFQTQLKGYVFMELKFKVFI